MQCDRARVLMTDVLDGAAVPELERHLAGCASCAAEMRAVQAVDDLLRSQGLLEPPPHFASRVMSHIDRRMRAMPEWQRAVLQVSAILSGTALVALTLVALVHGGRLASSGLPLGADMAAWLRGAGVALKVLTDRLDAIVVVGTLSAALAVVMALFWFGALVVPRHVPGAAHARSPRR